MIDTPLMGALGRVLDVTAQRHGVIARNLANIDTPGYRVQDLDFRAALLRAGAPPIAQKTMAPVRSVQGLVERPDGNNVNLERETLLLAQNQLLFQTGIQLLRLEFRRLATAIKESV